MGGCISLDLSYGKRLEMIMRALAAAAGGRNERKLVSSGDVRIYGAEHKSVSPVDAAGGA